MVSQQQVLEGVRLVAEKMKDNREFLTDLDAKIGDGDHGINMDRGFTAVLVKMETMPDADIGAILKAVGMALLSTVGGASGPLYGTAYMRIGAVLAGKMEINAGDALAALKAAQEGIQTRGKATEGEKTMLDALIPAIRALEKGLEDGLAGADWWAKGIEAAEAGIEYTKTIIATKGRASYLGERSLGFQDPGATSLTIMLKCFAPA
jgi:dihydroxyacetone kinase-like protein